MSKPYGNILVLGHGRHGKDTVADILAEHLGLKSTSSSWTALDLIYPLLCSVKPYKSKREAFDDRHNCRPLWKEAISLLNLSDPGFLCKEILKENDIYVGMRSILEFGATKKMFDWVIWVDASDRLPLEPSMNIDRPLLSYYVDNNGNLDDLHTEIDNLIKVMKNEKQESNTSTSNRFTCRGRTGS